MSNIVSAYIGSGKNNKYYDGMIDDVQIYNASLSATEVLRPLPSHCYSNTRYRRNNNTVTIETSEDVERAFIRVGVEQN